MTAHGAISLPTEHLSVTWDEHGNVVAITVNGDRVAMTYSQARHLKAILDFLFKDWS